jgi:methionine aminopeptidase
MPNTLYRLPLCMVTNKILFHIIPNSSASVLHEVALFNIKLTARLIKLHYVKARGGMVGWLHTFLISDTNGHFMIGKSDKVGT